MNTDSGVNFLQSVNFALDGYLDNDNVIQPYEAYIYSTDFIPIQSSLWYTISFASIFIGVFFDENYNLIGSIPSSTAAGTYNYDFLTPVNVKYLKVNIAKSDTVKSLKVKSYVKSYWQDKTIAWYGTSIPAGYPHSISDTERNIYSHANLAVHDLNAIIINRCVLAGGIGLGVGLSFVRTTDTINYQNSLLNLINTEAEPDLIVFDYGVNDYNEHPADIDAFDPDDPFDNGNTGIKTKLNSRDKNTFIGAHNAIIDEMLTLKPELKFCFITHFSLDNSNPSITKKQDNWKKLIQCQQALAEYWSVPILNLHERTGFRNRNGFNSIVPVIPDHIHPASGDGRSVESLRSIIRDFLNSIA